MVTEPSFLTLYLPARLVSLWHSLNDLMLSCCWGRFRTNRRVIYITSTSMKKHRRNVKPRQGQHVIQMMMITGMTVLIIVTFNWVRDTHNHSNVLLTQLHVHVHVCLYNRRLVLIHAWTYTASSPSQNWVSLSGYLSHLSSPSSLRLYVVYCKTVACRLSFNYVVCTCKSIFS